jgi:hypothetical protein
LAGYEDVHDAERLAAALTFRLISLQRMLDPAVRMARPGLCGGHQVTGVPTAINRYPNQVRLKDSCSPPFNVIGPLISCLTFGVHSKWFRKSIHNGAGSPLGYFGSMTEVI